MESHLLNSREVAEILHVSRTFAYLLMLRGDIPTVRMGRSVRVRQRDLNLYIEHQASLRRRTKSAVRGRGPRR